MLNLSFFVLLLVLSPNSMNILTDQSGMRKHEGERMCGNGIPKISATFEENNISILQFTTLALKLTYT